MSDGYRRPLDYARPALPGRPGSGWLTFRAGVRAHVLAGYTVMFGWGVTLAVGRPDFTPDGTLLIVALLAPLLIPAVPLLALVGAATSGGSASGWIAALVGYAATFALAYHRLRRRDTVYHGLRHIRD